ncbi:hypothetical protein [Spiroplasma endosymbiont of Stenodema calcarata]|uniref:hypothetical protein n=1 Tax=Spiroplasma endosymbiont of Stenodema calcarata TaxID=3139328 RepID=UPI003CCAE107
MMIENKINETKHLQEVNSNLKINVNQTAVIKALTESWKKSKPYFKLMAEYQKLNKTPAADWDSRYEKEYEKFIKTFLGESVYFKKNISKKPVTRVIKSKKSSPTKTKNMGLNLCQLDLLRKRKLYRSEELFPNRVIRGYQASQAVIESELIRSGKSFLNNNSLLVQQNEDEPVFVSTVKNTGETKKDNFTENNLLEQSTKNEVEDLINKLNPNQQRLIRQRNQQYGRFQKKQQEIIHKINDQNSNEILKSFNNQVKEHAKNWGLNKTQIELLSRRDAIKRDEDPYLNRVQNSYYSDEKNSRLNSELKPRSFDEIKEQMKLNKNQLKLLAHRDARPSELKQDMKQIISHKDDNMKLETVIKKRNQLGQEILARSLGKTKKQIDGKYIRNSLINEQKRKSIIKTDLYLDTTITSQIKPLLIKSDIKTKPVGKSILKPLILSLSAGTNKKLEPIELNSIVKENIPKESIALPLAPSEEKYVSIVDPKKRPNLKKLKFGDNYKEKTKKKLFITEVFKKDSLLDNIVGEKDSNNRTKEKNLILYPQKELKDYQINYVNTTKTPNLMLDLTNKQYNYAGYHPREIREIQRRQLAQHYEQLQKEKLIQKNLRKETRQQKKLQHRKVKPKPLPQILIDKYLAEGKKVVNGFLVDTADQKNVIEDNNK